MTYKKTTIILILFGFFLGMLFSYPPGFHSIDFAAWRGDYDILFCLLDGGENCGSLSKFPLAYLLNSFLSSFFSNIFQSADQVLLAINSLFLIVALVFIKVVSKLDKFEGASSLFFLALFFSIIFPFYFYAGALEFQSGVLLGIYSSCLFHCVIKKSKNIYFFVALFFSSLLIPLYKDTNIIFMGLVCFCIFFLELKSRSIKSILDLIKTSKASYLVIIVASVLSLALSVSYNLFRYNSVFPSAYFSEASMTSPPLMIKLQNFFWIIFSLNGGILVSWLFAITILVLGIKIKGRIISKYGLISSISLVVLMVFVLSSWWAPFGWDGWGNRLFLPIAVSCLITLVSTTEPKRSFDAVLKDNGFDSLKNDFNSKTILVAPFLIVSLVYLGITYSPKRDAFLIYSLYGGDACKAVAQLRGIRDLSFFKTQANFNCNLERFTYIPGIKKDLTPLSILDKSRDYVIRQEKVIGMLGEGWSQKEHWGIWSNGLKSEIRFIPDSQVNKITLKVTPFIVLGELDQQRVLIKDINGAVLYEGVVKEESTIIIPINSNKLFDPNEIFRVFIYLPNAKSPKDLSISNDKRELGIGLISLRFD